MPDTVRAEAPSSPARAPVIDRAMAWLKNRERRILLAGVVLQLVVLAGLVVYHALPIWFGDTILLRVERYRPRDTLHRDYVILSYDFGRIPTQNLPAKGGKRSQWVGRTMYVSLVPEPDGRHWRAERYSFDRPTRGKFLRGTITRYGRLEFGIESYYVQEGTGDEYERAIRSRKLSAEVAVDADGRARLRGLRIE